MTELRDKVAKVFKEAGMPPWQLDAWTNDILAIPEIAEALKLKAEHDTMMLGHSTMGSKS